METVPKLSNLIKEIVEQAAKLKDKHTEAKDAKVNYVAIFSQSDHEYNMLLELAKSSGKLIENTPTGPLFNLNPIPTSSGILKLLKVRTHDKTRPERGDADFTVLDYNTFKKTYLSKPGFKLIKRERFEMMELMDPDFNVRAYFSYPPLDEQLGIK